MNITKLPKMQQKCLLDQPCFRKTETPYMQDSEKEHLCFVSYRHEKSPNCENFRAINKPRQPISLQAQHRSDP